MSFIDYTTLLYVRCRPIGGDGTLDLQALVREFPLDLELRGDAIVERATETVVQRETDPRSTRSKNKELAETVRAYAAVNGFVKISYPHSADVMYFTNPPDLIPRGCYCEICFREWAHDPYCQYPKRSKVYYRDPKTLESVPLSHFLKLPKKDLSKFFPGPVMLKYKHGTSSITIRIRANGCFEMISIPWNCRALYLEVIDRINRTSQRIALESVSIKTFFGSCMIPLEKASPDLFSECRIRLPEFYSFLWPVDEDLIPLEGWPRTVGADGGSLLATPEGGSPVPYTCDIDSKSNNRIYINFLLPSGEAFPHIAVNAQLFPQGQIQMTFSCLKSIIGGTLDSQYARIRGYFQRVVDIVSFHLRDRGFVEIVPRRTTAHKIVETMTGTIPYAKQQRYLVGDTVEVFDWGRGVFDAEGRTVTAVVPIPETPVDYPWARSFTLDTGQTVGYNDLRKRTQNNDQVCRYKDAGIYRQPIPYSFFGRCPGGSNQYIRPMGVPSRADNRFYPGCTDVKYREERWLVDFLLGGYTAFERGLGVLDGPNMAGTLIPGTTRIGNEIDLADGRRFIIVDKKKLHGVGNDNLNVLYYGAVTPTTPAEPPEMITVTSRDFHPKYIEDRNFAGVRGRREVLLEAMRRLGLWSEPPAIRGMRWVPQPMRWVPQPMRWVPQPMGTLPTVTVRPLRGLDGPSAELMDLLPVTAAIFEGGYYGAITPARIVVTAGNLEITTAAGSLTAKGRSSTTLSMFGFLQGSTRFVSFDAVDVIAEGDDRVRKVGPVVVEGPALLEDAPAMNSAAPAIPSAMGYTVIVKNRGGYTVFTDPYYQRPEVVITEADGPVVVDPTTGIPYPEGTAITLKRNVMIDGTPNPKDPYVDVFVIPPEGDPTVSSTL